MPKNIFNTVFTHSNPSRGLQNNFKYNTWAQVFIKLLARALQQINRFDNISKKLLKIWVVLARIWAALRRFLGGFSGILTSEIIEK